MNIAIIFVLLTTPIVLARVPYLYISESAIEYGCDPTLYDFEFCEYFKDLDLTKRSCGS